MFKKISSYLLILIDLILVMKCSELFERTKRTDIDLTTCIDNFDIHKDKIIRTQDSQKMGAKYLNAIDLGSREECLRLCCETENCDVFVYEDKNSGSCYLFHCGPPEDFKCKFTHHVNYSSAVLAINRHIPDLESQIKLTKHEQDLTKLRKTDEPEQPSHIPEERIQTTVITTTTIKPKEIPERKIKIDEKKCSRYQFECRSTRECIAIYNACDGIPQCTDGSDEAAELGCPEISTLQPSSSQRAMANNIQQPQSYDKNVPVRNQEQPKLIEPYHPPVPRADALSPPNNAFLRPASQVPQRVPEYRERAEYNSQIQQMGWNQHQPYQLPPEYPDKTSHIFNHKENGLQVPEAEISSYPETPNYPKVPNYYSENYRQAMETPNWVNAHQNDLRYPSRYNQEPYYDNSRIIGTQPENNKYIPPIKTQNWPSDKENPEHVQIKMAHELKQSKVVQENHKNEQKIKIEVDKLIPEPKSIDYPDVIAYKMDGNDGVAQTPGGAVLSLTLGLIITFIMAIMIGCRLRMVKRRLRKGGKGYAHDADYLVNGMYL